MTIPIKVIHGIFLWIVSLIVLGCVVYFGFGKLYEMDRKASILKSTQNLNTIKNGVREVCVDGVVYLYLDTHQISLITVKLDKNSKVIVCT